ncbi:MAG: sirohydrochlorin cobaltochelatase [Desulfamplus sp.]|nr:sirohydrochlorin cobaltochelatase [Desulfamplus sp.]
MKKKNFYILAVAFAVLFSSNLFAGHHGGEKPMKKAILLVAFGSSEESARISFENIEKRTRTAYPDVPVFWAYTSHIIRNKLAKQGLLLDSPEVALAKLSGEGFTHVAVQSLHTIPGFEFHDLSRVVTSFKNMGAFKKIIQGYPLLATQEDMERVVEAVLKTIPKNRKKDEAVLLMGHGTHHPSNVFYTALMFQLQLRDPNIYVGNVEGYPEIPEIKEWLMEKKIKKAWLMPFMSVAGDHAKNDMAGDDDDSWKSILTNAGIECEVVLKGTAEYDEYVDIWVDHIKTPLAHF